MAIKQDLWKARIHIGGLYELKEQLPDPQRLKMLAIALNFPSESPHTPPTATDLEELERILKQHYRP